jgi:hypothetical protein
MDVWLISKLFLEGTPIKEGKTIIALHQKLDKHDSTTKRAKQQ